MPFDNDYLKLLKEWVKDLSDKTSPDRREIGPLIARLEAAERLIENPSAYGNDPDYEAWRKAAGK